jgi:cytochrome d ubiquinol oxidase subunit I
MQYPLWNMPLLGGALVIAGISIFHVIIAHFAVGAGFFNVLSEIRARRTGNEPLLRFVKDNSIFLIYLSFIAGALSGVGIWFSIGVVAPEATTYLIHLFFWVWACEYVFFITELASGYVYYYTWDKISPRSHILVGWVSAVSAFMSLVLINGIIAFMLTPGKWLATGSVRDAWFNPSFFPSTLIRTVSALALAGIFTAIVANLRKKKYNDAERTAVVSWGARFLLPLIAMPVLAYWYFSVVPPNARQLALGGTVAMTFIFAFGMIASALISLYAFFGMLRKSQDINLETALLMLAIAVIATGSMEFVREGIRKPYVLVDVMYSSGIMKADLPKLEAEGVLANSSWVKPDTVHYAGTIAKGRAIYEIECLRCHEIDGYNGMVPLVRDWNRPLITAALDHLDRIRSFMPPFIGTEEEKQALADYLLTLTRGGLMSSDTLQAVSPSDSTLEEGEER